MRNSYNLKINPNGYLEFGGCDCVDLAKEYGTPLYVMDEQLIRDKCRNIKKLMRKHFSDKGSVLYASKAFCTMAMCKIIDQEGLGLDVVSGGELYTAMKSQFPVDKIYFHGNNKTAEEIELAINNDIGRIVVDNKYEMIAINNIAKAKGKIVNISFRINPGVKTNTHKSISTGQVDSKFGVALRNNEAFELINEAINNYKNLNIVGLHCHLGSQLFDVIPYENAAKLMMNFIVKLKCKLGIELKELNLGGGYGVRYLPDQQSCELDKILSSISKVINEVCKLNEMNIPLIVIEPGRSIVSECGITLYTVGSIKEIHGIRKYVALDGGMTDNPRHALYEAKYYAEVVNKPLAEKDEIITLAGRCCESGDILIKDIKMPKIDIGDIVAILCTGAYNYSMANNYNRIPKPPVILVKDGKSKIIVKRETFDDIVRNDLML